VLAQHGLRSLLCEQKEFPVDKACGEGVMPTGLAQLNRLGVTRYLAAADFYPLAGIRYHSAAGRTATAAFAEGPGWGIRRTALSAALYQRARELECLEIRQGVRAEPVDRTAGYVTVRVGRERIVTRLLIGADGLNSGVRRWAGLDGGGRSLRRWGARQHSQLRPWSDYVEVYWGNGIEAYVTPCAPEQVGVAFLWDQARYKEVQGGRTLFASLLHAFPQLQARLEGARPTTTVLAVGPLHRKAKAPIADGVLLLGDAAGYLDAITGEGISLAMAEALLLQKTIVPLWPRPGAQGILSKSELAAYAQGYGAVVRPYYRMTGLLLRLSRYPALVERIIAVLAQQPDSFQHLLSANMGLASLWSPAVLARLLSGLLYFPSNWLYF
jgi:flavin-dependent dehydrogenase